MQRDIPIGLGAGLAAAILLLAPVSGSGLGFLLALFAALPITLATLCWGSRAGLAASVAAMLVLALVASALPPNATETTPLRFGLQFGVSRALPAWGLAYLVIAGFGEASAESRHISLGTLAIVAAVLSMAGTLFALPALGSSHEQIIATLQQEVTQAYRIMMSVPKDQPIPPRDGIDAEAFLRAFSVVVLPIAALFTTAFNLCGLWLSARIALISGRLPRPWPDVARELRLPQWSLGLLAVACALSLLPGTVGFAGQLLLAALLGAFLVQGFAVMHVLSRGNGLRPFMLGLAYLLSVFLATIIVPLIVLLGLVETFFNLRGRVGSRAGSTKPPR